MSQSGLSFVAGAGDSVEPQWGALDDVLSHSARTQRAAAGASRRPRSAPRRAAIGDRSHHHGGRRTGRGMTAAAAALPRRRAQPKPRRRGGPGRPRASSPVGGGGVTHRSGWDSNTTLLTKVDDPARQSSSPPRRGAGGGRPRPGGYAHLRPNLDDIFNRDVRIPSRRHAWNDNVRVPPDKGSPLRKPYKPPPATAAARRPSHSSRGGGANKPKPVDGSVRTQRRARAAPQFLGVTTYHVPTLRARHAPEAAGGSGAGRRKQAWRDEPPRRDNAADADAGRRQHPAARVPELDGFPLTAAAMQTSAMGRASGALRTAIELEMPVDVGSTTDGLGSSSGSGSRSSASFTSSSSYSSSSPPRRDDSGTPALSDYRLPFSSEEHIVSRGGGEAERRTPSSSPWGTLPLTAPQLTDALEDEAVRGAL
jgi:hypothetical protein